MLQKLQSLFATLLSKIGPISHRVLTYVNIGISVGTTLEQQLANTNNQLIIQAVLGNLGIEGALLEDVIAAIPVALKYLTEAEGVLTAGDANQMLSAFLNQIKTDTAGMQKTKIWALVQKVVSILDNAAHNGPIYRILINKQLALSQAQANTGTPS